MDQQAVEGAHPGNESDDKPKKKPINWRRVFNGRFWTDNPLALVVTTLGTFAMAPALSFPGGNPKHLWYVALGLWVVCGGIIYWVFSGVIEQMEKPVSATAEKDEVAPTAEELRHREEFRPRLAAVKPALEQYEIGKPIKFQVKLLNTGKTPAHIKHGGVVLTPLTYNLVASEEMEKVRAELIEKTGPQFPLRAGGDYTWHYDAPADAAVTTEFDRLLGEKYFTLFAMGVFVYADQWGKERNLEFIFKFDFAEKRFYPAENYVGRMD